MSLNIRPAVPGDAETIVGFIRGLAEHEKSLDEVDATPALLDAALFGASPRAFCDIAEWNGAPAGMALWFYNFSTQRGRHGIYLDDLFVLKAYRGEGIGKALLARLARRCIAEDLPRFDWSVLDTNVSAIGFYESIGAQRKEDGRTCRIEGAALEALAAHP